MERFTNAIYQNIYSPQTFDELMRLVSDAPDGAASLVRMWRGQANADWKLDSSAYRRLAAANKRPVVERDIVNYENLLLKHAKHKGFQYMDGHELSDLELLSRLEVV